MSTKAVIIWLVLAVVLGIVAILALWYGSGESAPLPGSAPVGTLLLHFSPGDVERVKLSGGGQPTQIVEKAPGAKGILGADADWQLRIEPTKKGEAALAPWPIESSKMQTLLRVLAEMRSAAVPAAGSELGHPTIVELHLSGDRTITLSLAERTLAGTGLAEIENPPVKPVRALIEDRIHAVFTNPGPRAWRDPFPFGGIAPDASRIRVEGKGKPVALAKVEGKWWLREPVAAPADGGAVQRWLGVVAHVAVADFLDSGTSGAATGLDKPTGSLAIEVDRRIVPPGEAVAKESTDTLRVTIGGAADAGANTVFASVGPNRVVLLDSRSLLAVTSDAAAFVWPHPLRQAAADIGSLAIKFTTPAASTSEHAFRRSGVAWAQVGQDKSNIPLSEKDEKDVQGLLLMLTGPEKTGAPSNLPRPTITLDAPAGFRSIGTIVVNSIADAPIDTLEFGTAGKDQTALRTGPIFRTYSTNQLPQLLLAAVSAGTPADSEPPTR